MATPSHPEDLALVARCLRGEEAAWREFVDRLGPRLRGLARRRGAGLDPDDAVSEAFLHLLADGARVLSRYRGEAPLEAYVHVVACRLWIDRMRTRRPGLSLDAVPEPESLPEAGSGDGMEAALAILPEAWAAALRLVYAEGLSHAEAGRRLGIPSGTVSTWVARSLRRLAGKIRKP